MYTSQTVESMWGQYYRIEVLLRLAGSCFMKLYLERVHLTNYFA